MDATIAATATATATRARDDDEGTGTTTFGAFGTLPDELVVRVLEKLGNGHALAMAACACRDFERLIGTRETLWRDAATGLRRAGSQRRDLVREDAFDRRCAVGEETSGGGGVKFPRFNWKELYMWRVHVLKKSAQLDTAILPLAEGETTSERRRRLRRARVIGRGKRRVLNLW